MIAEIYAVVVSGVACGVMLAVMFRAGMSLEYADTPR